MEAYEDKYRGRELPGFINYKTFEVMVKEQIKQLEEPAVKKLKDIGGLLLQNQAAPIVKLSLAELLYMLHNHNS